MLEELKHTVWEANLKLVEYKLVLFTWGKKTLEAAKNAAVLEEVSKMAYLTDALGGGTANKYIRKKHYERKHGPNAYYGQKR